MKVRRDSRRGPQLTLAPTGNYLCPILRSLHVKKHHTDWGDAINFDARIAGPVREFFLANAGYWIEEFHIDGLRLDAVHSIVDRF